MRAQPLTAALGPRWLALVIGSAMLAAFWVSAADAASRLPRPFDAASGAGTVLMVTGIALRYLSIRTLGAYIQNEVAILPGQPLVTRGIFRLLRHPSETGTLCLAFGGVVLLGSLAGAAVCAAVLLPCVIWRTRLEDVMLRRHHPVAFRRYAGEVGAFFPRIRPAIRGG